MRIMICDDDAVIRQSLLKMLKLAYTENNLPWEEPKCAASAEELLANISKGQTYDLIYLDIEMPGASGMEAAAQIRTHDRQVQFIFVTSHKDYVYDVFQVMPLDFLIKPINCQKFLGAFGRALENYRWQHQTITCKLTEGVAVIETAEIVYACSEGKLIHLYLHNGEHYQTRQTMTEMAAQLELYHIIRCHRSYLVNLAYVQGLANRRAFRIGQRSEGKEVLITIEGQRVSLPIGEKYLDNFQQQLMQYQQQGGRLY